MATLYLVRHGQASFGAADYDQLSPIGLRQARLAGRYLQRAGAPISQLLCGSLVRQRDTAREIANCLSESRGVSVQPIVDVRFNELDLESQFQCIVPELAERDGRIAELVAAAKESSSAYQRLLKRVFAAWQTHAALPSGVEPWAQFCVRVQSAIADIQNDSDRGASVVVVTSGGVIANVARLALDLPPAATYQLFEVMMNGSVTRLLYDQRRISLSSFNECSYLWADEHGRADPRLLTFR